MASEVPKLVTSADEVSDISRAIRAAGLFALDLEFASDGRYVPDLCLVQVAWQDVDKEAPRYALLDAQAARLDDIFALIEDADLEVVIHAGRQDIALLATRFQVAAKRILDTQIGAAFLGIGEQVGYGRLVAELLDIRLDKGPQFTNWSKRPLSERQLHYATADVVHLFALWPLLREKLAARGRLAWAAEESAAMVDEVEVRVPPEERFRSIGGWASLRGKGPAAIVELAAWREREALESNKPPSWILPDSALVDLCRKLAKTDADLRRAKGVGASTVKHYGADILEAIRRGAESEGPELPRKGSSLPAAQQPVAALINALVAGRCALETLPGKLVASKGDCEDLVAWHAANGSKETVSAEPAVLRGWRREFVGDDALALLRGEAAIVVRDGNVDVTRNE